MVFLSRAAMRGLCSGTAADNQGRRRVVGFSPPEPTPVCSEPSEARNAEGAFAFLSRAKRGMQEGLLLF
jgi:hypothetical protein